MLAVSSCYLLLRALGLERDPSLLVCLLLGCLLSIAGLSNYLRERRFVRALRRLAEGEGDVLAQVAELPQPGYLEGDLAWSALARVAREMRARVGESRAEVVDYRRYVETWVHEVKTPLSAAHLMLENLADPRLRPLAVELGRVDDYIEQALFYARSSSLENDYLIRRCDLGWLVRCALRARRQSLIASGMSVDLEGLGDRGVIVACDSKWMVFILGQILDNAVRYRRMPGTGEHAPRISFSASVLGEGTAEELVELSVEDNGCGIAQSDLGRVFDRGFTGANGRSRSRSTGLGLYLVRMLCEKMGVLVRMESEQGSWTRVTLSFPRQGLDRLG